MYKASGGKEFYSGRGKKHLLEVMGEEIPSAIFEDIFSKCLLCGACTAVCPRGVDIPEEVRQARSTFRQFYGEHGYQKFLARKVLENPELLGVVRKFGRTFARLLDRRLPVESGLRLQLAIFDHPVSAPVVKPEKKILETEAKKSLVYFPGCSASYLYPESIAACNAVFSTLGYRLTVPEGLGCCGLAIDSAGDIEQSRKMAKQNILALERNEGPIMVSCGSCYSHLQRYGEVLADEPAWHDRVEYVCDRLVEMSQFLDRSMEKVQNPDGDMVPKERTRVFYHDPCPMRHELKITREPRDVLKRFQSVELLDLEDGQQCCGQGGLFHIGAPELAAVIRDDLAEKVLALNPEIITSTCSGCLMQWKSALAAAGKNVSVLHLAELLDRLQKKTTVN